MSFAEPLWIVLGAGVALLVAVGLRSRARRRRRLAGFFGGRRAGRRLTGEDLHRSPAGRVALLGLAALALGAAASGPRWSGAGSADPPPPASVVLALDVSGSMQATDVAPTRLGRGAEVARELLAGLDGQRVGLLLFAGTPYELAPPTADHRVLEYLLEGVAPDVVSMEDPGTRISEALRRAGELLAEEGSGAPRSVVLVGDGDTGEEPSAVAEAARALAAEGIAVHAVGVGTAAGSEVVLPVGYRRGGRLTDESGAPVVSRLGEETLRRVARAGGGRYAGAGDAGGLRGLRRALDPPPAGPAGGSGAGAAFPTFLDPAVGLAALALVLLVAESLLDVRLPGRAPSPVRGSGRGPAAKREARRSG